MMEDAGKHARTTVDTARQCRCPCTPYAIERCAS